MSWAKFDDQFYTHPKLAALGYYALPCVGLTVLATCWSSSTLTDGHIPRGQIFKLCGDIDMLLPSGKPWEMVNEMVNVAMWDLCEIVEHGECYVIHDYLDYNPSRATVLAEREALHTVRSLAGRSGGRRSAEQRASKAEANEQAKPKQNPSPGPVPVPRVAKATTPKPPRGDVVQVWETWLDSTGRTTCKLDDKRKRIITARLADYPLDDVLDAVQGWVRDPWEGRRQQNEIALLLRDNAHLEKFRDLWRQPSLVAAAADDPNKTAAVAFNRRWNGLVARTADAMAMPI